MKLDLRSAPRLRLARPAPATTKFGPVEILDFGPTGLGICNDFQLERGVTFWMELKWGNRSLHLNCEVRSWRLAASGMRYRTGLCVKSGGSADEYRQLVEKEIAKMNAPAKPVSAVR